MAGGTPNALAARNASQTIPIVVVGATAPISGNVTGVTIDVDPRPPEPWA